MVVYLLMKLSDFLEIPKLKNQIPRKSSKMFPVDWEFWEYRIDPFEFEAHVIPKK